jgi:hypothetical protein
MDKRMGLVLLALLFVAFVVFSPFVIGGAIGFGFVGLAVGPQAVAEAAAFWALLIGGVAVLVLKLPMPGMWRLILGSGMLLGALLLWMGVL